MSRPGTPVQVSKLRFYAQVGGIRKHELKSLSAQVTFTSGISVTGFHVAVDATECSDLAAKLAPVPSVPSFHQPSSWGSMVGWIHIRCLWFSDTSCSTDGQGLVQLLLRT